MAHGAAKLLSVPSDRYSVSKVNQSRHLPPSPINLALQWSILLVNDKVMRTVRGKASEGRQAAMLEGEPSLNRTTSDGQQTASDRFSERYRTNCKLHDLLGGEDLLQ